MKRKSEFKYIGSSVSNKWIVKLLQKVVFAFMSLNETPLYKHSSKNYFVVVFILLTRTKNLHLSYIE